MQARQIALLVLTDCMQQYWQWIEFTLVGDIAGYALGTTIAGQCDQLRGCFQAGVGDLGTGQAGPLLTDVAAQRGAIVHGVSSEGV